MRGTPRLDFSIAGDEQEQHRIQLEHNLQHTDLSLHLSSAHDDYSLEYPRHHPGPTAQFSGFASFDHSREDFDPEEGLSHMHAWSYRTGDDEEGINPYGGETMSTAAHHASALTISAGLGGRGMRRDISLSGAEYDPDRPLQDLVANIDSKFSLMENDTARSRQIAPYNQLVADSPADLDRVLASQQARATAARFRSPRSPHSSATSSSEPDTPDPNTSFRPKLSDALSHLSFSPKRPRSPQLSFRSSSPVPSHTRSHRSRGSNVLAVEEHHLPPPSQPSLSFRGKDYQNEPTPKPKKTRPLPARASGPEITVRPPTPSSNNSRFTKLARGLARELETEQSRWQYPEPSQEDGALAQGTVNARVKPPAGSSRPPFVSSKRTNKSGIVQLPDVTGLTNAVESPVKAGLQYYGYPDDDDINGDKAHLLTALNQVQHKLAHLEAENNTSRKRMREFERELDTCRQEVARERERVQRREDVIARQQRETEVFKKGKGRMIDDGEEDHKRYKEAVEEKKALESLISTLRSHMSRLTNELASHQSLLDELRSLRAADSYTLHEKVREVDRLRTEVEKVAGEVEVLKGVVEEGLRERRNRQERSQASIMDSEPYRQMQAPYETQEVDPQTEGGEADDSEQEQETREEAREDTAESSRLSVSPTPPRTALPDRTMRTDQATAGTSQLIGTSTRRYVNSDELERISMEMEERRSERSLRSASRLSNSYSRSRSAANSPVPSRSPSVAGSVSGSERSAARSSRHFSTSNEDEGTGPQQARAASPTTSHTSQRLRRPFSSPLQIPAESRPPAPTPAHAVGIYANATLDADKSHIPAPTKDKHRRRGRNIPPPSSSDAPASTPFPEIRGARLERMFFSAPAHNEKTCRMCRRRQRPHSPLDGNGAQKPLWYPASRGRDVRARVDDEEEGGNDNNDWVEGAEPNVGRDKGKASDTDAYNLEFLKRSTPRDRLPPQTVLVRVLRELEDDFTHYKGIYTELADQYKLMDPASNVVKRNVLAEHLREVIDILEQKGDQIASLYDLLTFEDKPVADSVIPEKVLQRQPHAGPSGIGRSKKHTAFV